MRRTALGLGLLLLAPLSALAQPGAALPPGPKELAPLPVTSAPTVAQPFRDALFPTPENRARFHVEADYLLWFLKPNRLSTPVLLTVKDQTEDLAATFAAGGLADPNAVALFGGRNIDRSFYSGGSINLSFDLTDDGKLAAEAGGLWLPRQGNTYHYASNAKGVPALILPFFDPTSALGGTGETGGSFAGNFGGIPSVGHVDIRTATQLWGGDGNLSAELYRTDKWRLQGLGGVRYLAMNDLFQETAVLENGFGGKTYDRFATANNFYGGQLGLRLVGDLGWIRPSLTTKVALGATQETLDISGSALLPTNAIPPAGTHQLPGGFYTASSNLGNSTQTRFAVVSETNLGVAMKVSDWASVTLGYSFLYWSNVERSGDQVTRVLNSQLNPAFSTFTTAPGTGPHQPARLNKETDFWGHGVNLGIEFRY